MSQLVGKVEDAFTIRNRGVVVFLDVAWTDFPKDWRLKIGDEIEFRSTSDVPFRSKIAGIELLDPPPPNPPVVFLLPSEVGIDQIRLGAEMWKLS